MMILMLGVKDFKRYKDFQLNLDRPITLILGPNSSGKSSIIKAALALKQTFSATNEAEALAAQGEYVDLGTFSEYAFKHDASKNVILRVILVPPQVFHKKIAYFDANNISYEIEYSNDPLTSQARLERIKISFSVSLGDGGNPSPSGEGKCVVMWSREKVSCWSAHEVRFKGALGVDSKIPEEGACGSGCDSCARPVAADSDGARVGDYFWEGCTRPRPHIFELSTESGYQHDCAMDEGDQFTCTPSGVSVLA